MPEKIMISKDFVEEDIMPSFEEGFEQEEERAFALFGFTTDSSIDIQDWRNVPEENCRGDRFEPIKVQRKNFLGYIHSHILRGEEPFSFHKTWLSEGDCQQMAENDELIRGIGVLPLDSFVQAVIVFWRRNFHRPLPIQVGKTKYEYMIYLQKDPDLEWEVVDVRNKK